MFEKALFELVQQFYHATEIANVATCGQRLRWSALAQKIKTIVADKWTTVEHHLNSEGLESMFENTENVDIGDFTEPGAGEEANYFV